MSRVIGGNARGLCAVCGRYVAVRVDGLVRPHGPLENRCDGGGDPPAVVLHQRPQPPARVVKPATSCAVNH